MNLPGSGKPTMVRTRAAGKIAGAPGMATTNFMRRGPPAGLAGHRGQARCRRGGRPRSEPSMIRTLAPTGTTLYNSTTSVERILTQP